MTSVAERFENKVRVTPGCWEWLGTKHGKGYGHFRLARDGSVEKAHRAAYMMYVGEIPPGLMVLHTCDNPSCVNPEHLWVGTNDDNMKDMVAKGRGNAPRGEDQHLAKLNEDQVVQIRSDSRTMKSIARDFGVSAACICAVKNRQTWRHV